MKIVTAISEKTWLEQLLWKHFRNIVRVSQAQSLEKLFEKVCA